MNARTRKKESDDDTFLQKAMDNADEALAAATKTDAAALTAERHNTHGPAAQQFRTAQQLKTVIRLAIMDREALGYDKIDHVQVEALEQIEGKISRILWGESSFPDHWDDISGYAHLGKTKGVNG